MRKLTVRKGVMSEGDISFLWNKAMPVLGIKREIRVEFSRSNKTWPDIWCSPSKGIITVTKEWQKQNAGERRCRLVHELLHFKGLEHGKYEKLEYSTCPQFDTYSKIIYKKIVKLFNENPVEI